MQAAPKKVVIGDRDAIVLALVSHILKREGYVTHPVDDREELLRVLQAGEFDAAVVDALLDGVIDVVKTVPARTRIIVTSPHDHHDGIGVHATLRKPLEFGLLIDTVRDCVAQGE